MQQRLRCVPPARPAAFFSGAHWGRLLAVLALLLTGSTGAWAQLTGTQTIPGSYASVAAAITALNAQGVGSGGVTFNVAAGYAETFASPTAGRITLNSTSTNPSTGANPIVFQKSGTGANPQITAGVGTTTTLDAIIALVGTDYVTFDGIDVTEAAANTTATTQAEFGYALFRPTATDGCQNNTIKNCVVTLNKTNANTIGISGQANTAASATAVAATSTAGTNSGNLVFTNVVTNANIGINFAASSSTTTANYDAGNLVGITALGFPVGNTVGNFGGTASGWGIGGSYQAGLKISNNTINSTRNYTNATTFTSVAASTVTNILRGVYGNTGTSANVDISNNTITLASGGTTTALTGIENSIGSTASSNTVNLTGNTVQMTYNTATTAAISGVFNSASAATVNLTGNTVQNLSATAATTATFYGIYNTGAGTTVNMNTNTVSGNVLGSSSTATTSAFYGVYSAAAATTLNANSNVVQNNTHYTTSGTMALVYGASNPTNFNVGSNQLTGNTKSGATANGNLFGIYATTSVVSATNNVVSNNTLTSGGTSASTLYGYYDLASASSETVTGNTFSNLTINGTSTATGHAIGGVRSYTTSSDVLTVGQNTILTLAISAGSGTAYGVYITTGSGTVSRNKIADLSVVGAAGTAYGINISGGSTFTAANNLVGDLRTPASTSLVAVSGLYATSATTFNAYFNTIYLNASGGATFGTSGIYLNSTSTTLDARNNIVVNTSTAAGTGGYTAAFRRVSGTAGTAPANYATTSNNNLFYTGTPSATNLIYVEGTTTATNAQQTLAAYKAFMGNRDQSAVTENPPFISTTGSDATYLHISTSTATQVESGGVAISGYTTDFDGDSRNTIPDIGADEGSFTPSDQSPPSISYTALGTTSSTSSRALTVTINDPSGVAGGANAPRLYYRVGTSGAYSFVTASSTSVTGLNNGTYTFTIPGAPGGSTVQYYVAAQDASANNNSGTNPGGGSGTPPGSTPPTTPSSYQVLQSLAGTYYVGTGTGCGTPTYPTLTAAVADYNAKGQSGPITFQLVDNAYTGETYPITINATLDASSTNTLTIKPCPSASPVFTGSTAGPMLVINGTSYITLDGSNAGTTSQNWTLNNTNTGGSGVLVQLNTSTGGAPPTYNTVRNLVLTGAASATTFTTLYGIRMANASPATTGANNNTFANNAITKVQTGISVVGLSTSVRDANNSITGNQIGSATTAAGFGGTAAVGISLNNQNTLTVTGNVVRNPVIVAAGATAAGATALISATSFIGIDLTSNITTATVANNTVRDLLTSGSTTYNTPVAGIRVGTAVTSATLNANLVTNVKTTATGGYGAYGMEVFTATANAGDVLSNNMVSDINGSTNYTAFANSSSAGIYLVGTTSGGSAQSGITVVYNSVNIYGTSTYGSAVNTAALAVEVGVTGLTVRNNVLSNSNVGSTSGSLPYSLYSYAPASAYTTINNNDYYSSGSQAPTSNVQVYVGSTAYTTLAGVQGATSQDGASISTAPGFTAPNDLHTTNTNLRAGAPIAGITTDFDGDSRDATTPTLGADEVAGISNDAGVVAITQPTAPFAAGSQSVAVQVKNFGVATLNSVTVSWTVNGVAQTPATFTSLGLAPGATSGNLTLGSYNFAVGSTYAIVATTSGPNGGTDGNTANDSFTRTVAPSLIGTYTVGAGQQFTTLTNAVNALNAGGVLGAVTFSLTDASYSTSETFPIVINTILGGSSTNTLTIKPASGVSPTIAGSVATGAVLKLSGADYVTIDGSNAGTTSRDLTITNTSATGTGNAVLWLAAASASDGATNNVVKNTNITGNSSTGNPQFTVFVGGSGTTPTTSTPAANSNNTIQNNVITKGYYGLFMYGVSTTVLDQSNVVTGNQIGQSATGTGFGQEGMRAVYQQGLSVTGNEIQNVTNSTNTANLYALYLVDTKGTVVSRNSVHNISYTGTGTYKVWAIESGTATFNTAGNASANRFDNNLVYAINSTTASSTWNTVGINANGGYGDQYYFNTVYLSGQLSAAGGTAGSAAFANGNPSVSTTSTNIDVRNNIFSIIGGTGGTTSTALYAHYEQATSVAGSTLNYNDLYVTAGATGLAVIGHLGTSASPTGDYATLAAWQAATSQEANSVSVDPGFTQTATVPYNLTPSNAVLNNVAATGTGITVDYTGATRSSTPDIGALEFVPATLDIKPSALVAPSATQTCFGTAEAVTVQIQNLAATTVDFSASNAPITVVVTPPTGANQTFNTTLTSGTLASGATQNVTLPGTLDMSATGTYSFAITATVAGDANTSNDNLTVTRTNSVPQSTLPYSETFASSSLPTNFTATSFSTSTSANNGASGSYGLRTEVYYATTRQATTPILGYTVSSNNTLSFDARFTNYSTSGPSTVLQSGDNLAVQVAVCGGAFTTVYTIDNTNQNGTGAASTSFYTYTVPLTGIVAGQKLQVRFVANYGGSSSTDFYADLDNINVVSLAPNDAGVAAITQPTAPFTAGPQPVSVQVKNFGSATLNSVTVSWTVNGVAQTPQTFTGLNLASNATSGNLSLGSYDFSTGGPTFTIVATTSAPNGGTDGGTANDSFTRVVTPTLNGVYTVGVGKQFATLTSAVSTLNSAGVSGPVTFSLTDASYSTNETFPISITSILGGSSTNTLTIKPASGVSPALSGSSAGPLLVLNGASYVTLDGSNAGTATQNWTLTNTSTSTSAALVQLTSNTGGTTASNNTVKNLVLTGAASTTTFTTVYGVQLLTTTNATAGATGTTIQNNAITKVQTGITVAGLSTTVRNSGTSITGNQIGSTTAAAGFGGTAAKGIVASNENTLTVTGNVVRNPVIVAAGANATSGTALISSATLIGIDLTSNITTATVANNTVRDLLTSGSSAYSTPAAGIRVGTAVTSATVNANLVTNVKTSATNGFGAYGIIVNTGTASTGDVVSNNMVSDINGSNYTGFSNSSSAGIYLYGTQSGITIAFNSVNLYGTSTYASAVNTAALAVESGSTGLTVRNNVLSNSNVGSTAGSLPYSLYSIAPFTAYTVLDNNDYYSSGSQAPASNMQVYVGSTAYTDLPTLKSANTSYNQAAISTNPQFTANNDLHTLNTSLRVGAPVTGITTDFDGDTRDAAVPTAGADEVAAPAFDAGVVAITQPTAPFAAASQTVSVQVKNFGATTLNSVTVSWTVNGVAQAPQTFTGLNLAPGATSGDLNLGTYDFSTGGPNFTIVATTSAPNGNGGPDGNPANDSFTRTVAPGLIGTYTVGSGGQFTTLTSAVNTLNVAGVLGAVTFSLTDASYTTSETFPISINSVLGGSSTNTVTIKPASGVTATVSGSSATAILKLNGADYITVDGSNTANGTSRNLSVTNTSTGTSALVVWLASVSASDGATYNTIKNLNLTGGSNSASQSAIGVLGTGLTTKGQGNNNNTLQNNTAIRVTIGINAQSVFGTAYQNLVIVDNVLGSPTNTAADNLTTGIFLTGTPSVQVTHNTVQNLGSGAAGTPIGIVLLRGTSGALVNRNTVRGVRYTGTDGYGARGISVSPGASATGIILRNNAVSAVTADGDGSTVSGSPAFQIMGIGLFTGSGYSVYNNSVQLSGDRASNTYTTQISAAMWVDSSATSVDVRNNVLSNVQTTSNTSSTGTNYGLYATVAASAFSALDYNLYDLRSGSTFRTEAASPQYLGRLAGTNYSTLAAWQAATGQSRSSMLTSGANTPGFTSATDLTPNPADPGSYSLNGTGVQLSSVTTDLNGAVTRSTTVATGAPDLGAYEVTPTATPNALDVTGTPGAGNTQTFSFNGRQVASIAYGAAGTPPTTVTVRYYPGTNPPAPFASGAKYANAYFNVTDSGNGTGFTYTPTLTYDPALLGTIASESAQQVSLRNADNSGYDTYASTVNTTNRTVASNLQLSRTGLLALSDAAAPLPVTLVRFEAQRQGSDALLSWTTASELDNRGFEVQVSTDGQKYRTLGFVAGAGSSSTARSYSFVDHEAGKAGVRYYRLNQLDLSGKSSYSPVRTLTFEVAELLVQAAPNPFAGSLTLTLSLPGATPTPAELQLSDALGRTVLHQSLGTLPAGTTQADVPGAGELPAGFYLLRVTAGGQSRTLKVVRE